MYNLKAILFVLLLYNLRLFSQSEGHLVIIGGGERTKEIMNKIKSLSSVNQCVLIIPNASSEPEVTGNRLKEEFKELGFSDIYIFNGKREQANDERYIDKFSKCNVVFFSGGDQNLLTKDLLNTSLLKLIKKIYMNGGIICGTSAGAAVMSKMMITGDEFRNKDSSNPFSVIEVDNIVNSEGFGFLDDTIIDQHFIKRSRLNRLISLVMENTDKLGIGIDESTAIVVYPDRVFEVVGESQVIIFDASKSTNLMINEKKKLGGHNIVMHVLLPGQKFHLDRKEIVK